VIVVDASALFAIYLNEPERAHFLAVIKGADAAFLAPVNAWEALAKAHAVDGYAGAAEFARAIRPTTPPRQ
jgi:uncharacterized protein with PIN domain